CSPGTCHSGCNLRSVPLVRNAHTVFVYPTEVEGKRLKLVLKRTLTMHNLRYFTDTKRLHFSVFDKQYNTLVHYPLHIDVPFNSKRASGHAFHGLSGHLKHIEEVLNADESATSDTAAEEEYYRGEGWKPSAGAASYHTPAHTDGTVRCAT